MLNIAKNLYRGLKVTLLFAAVVFTIAVAGADDDQTLVTLKGQKFEKVRVTEITPATVTIRHSHGLARMLLADFPADVQKRFGYDEAKARAWLAAQVKAADKQQRQEASARAKNRAEGEKNLAEVERMHAYLSNAVYDVATHRWYLSQEDAAPARRRALNDALKAKHDAAQSSNQH
jgi:hypothetical protein